MDRYTGVDEKIKSQLRDIAKTSSTEESFVHDAKELEEIQCALNDSFIVSQTRQTISLKVDLRMRLLLLLRKSFNHVGKREGALAHMSAVCVADNKCSDLLHTFPRRDAPTTLEELEQLRTHDTRSFPAVCAVLDGTERTTRLLDKAMDDLRRGCNMHPEVRG